MHGLDEVSQSELVGEKKHRKAYKSYIRKYK